MKRYISTVRVIEGTRSSTDARRRVDKHICEYRDQDGTEYRKGFEVRPGEPFTPPGEVI